MRYGVLVGGLFLFFSGFSHLKASDELWRNREFKVAKISCVNILRTLTQQEKYEIENPPQPDRSLLGRLAKRYKFAAWFKKRFDTEPGHAAFLELEFEIAHQRSDKFKGMVLQPLGENGSDFLAVALVERNDGVKSEETVTLKKKMIIPYKDLIERIWAPNSKEPIYERVKGQTKVDHYFRIADVLKAKENDPVYTIQGNVIEDPSRYFKPPPFMYLVNAIRHLKGKPPLTFNEYRARYMSSRSQIFPEKESLFEIDYEKGDNERVYTAEIFPLKQEGGRINEIILIYLVRKEEAIGPKEKMKLEILTPLKTGAAFLYKVTE